MSRDGGRAGRYLWVCVHLVVEMRVVQHVLDGKCLWAHAVVLLMLMPTPCCSCSSC
jgi:hypothetical protein